MVGGQVRQKGKRAKDGTGDGRLRVGSRRDTEKTEKAGN